MDRSRATPGPGVWAVAATFIGTVVGAGFASGQEILAFFTVFGWAGTIGALLAVAGFAWCAGWWLELGAATGATSYHEALHARAGPLVGRGLDGLLAAALFVGVGIMTAGAAAVAEEQLGLPPLAGRLLFVLLCVATVWHGLPGVVAANLVVVPLLAVAVLLVTARALWHADLPGDLFGHPPPGGSGWRWLVSAVLYVSFNMLLALTVLVPLGAAAGPRARRAGGLLGAAGLGLLLLLMHAALLTRMPAVATREVPILELARGLAPAFGFVLALALWTEIYTTAVGGLYGFASRLGPPESAAYRLALLLTAGAALWIADTGFARLVRTIYPLKGWLGLALILWLLWTRPAGPPPGAPGGRGSGGNSDQLT